MVKHFDVAINMLCLCHVVHFNPEKVLQMLQSVTYFLGQLNFSDQFSDDKFACVAHIFAFEVALWTRSTVQNEALIAIFKATFAFRIYEFV